jgi:DNA-binding NarL/FixJ family response regulator
MRQTLLLVEPSDQTRRHLSRWLRAALPGARVVPVKTLMGAVLQAAVCTPDVILSELALPGAREGEVIREIMSSAPSAHLVILTDRDEDQYRCMAAAAGVSGYLTKSRAPAELLPLLQELL